MTSETKTCQNCKQEFFIEPEDFSFYEKMKVPAPTWCPECQLRRLMAWRNERSLYKREDDSSGKDIISIFSPDKPFTVYERGRWWSDNWDPLSYGMDYDFSKPFFVQFRELLERVPLESLFNKNAVQSDFCNHTEYLKNCYLIFGSAWNENVLYAKGAVKCKDSLDILFGDKSELVYENIGCEECYRVLFSKYSSNCTDSSFLLDCRGCTNCFGCINLRNKSYYIFNKPHSKEDYFKKMSEFELGSFNALEKIKAECKEFFKKYPYRYAHVINSPNSTGDILWDCKNCKWSFDITDNVENCKYLVNGGYNVKDSYCGYGIGVGELMYEVIDTGFGVSRVFSAIVFRNGTDASYVFDCHSSSHLFGCIGLRNKQYCILNKQYSKEQYEELLPRIKEHMNSVPYADSLGRTYKCGEFFPPELSPFAYNETVAQEYYPLTKEEAEKQGYKWKDLEPRNYQITKLPDNLPDHIKDVTGDILNQIIQCAHNQECNDQCTQAFKIIQDELQFYRRMSLPLPRLCPNCRHYERLKQRNPLKLWHRKCQCGGPSSDNSAYINTISHLHGQKHCLNEFETSYAPERPEIIYCEECYNKETQ
ncbi:MAG: hypothetical protein HY433_01635 [Candidatus Liptonbacteria bacterium]|nr:hypothetical protein [Candidatus Liptonbacteria bacterium]